MGAAIACFPAARAVDVPRCRFALVKTTADLLTLRSDAYDIRPDCTVALAPRARRRPPEKLVFASPLLVGTFQEFLRF